MGASELSKPKVYCEFLGKFPDDNSRASLPRFDFYNDRGMIASCYGFYIAAVVKAELLMLGYEVVDFPEVVSR